jgi:hypothetical protein
MPASQVLDINLAAELKVSQYKQVSRDLQQRCIGQYQNTLLHPFYSAPLLTWTVTFSGIIMMGGHLHIAQYASFASTKY